MGDTVKKKKKNFPLRLEPDFSKEIDNCVFYSDSKSKHQYIIDAIKERVERDKIKHKDKIKAQ